MALEKKYDEEGKELSEEQSKHVEKHNQNFKERHVESSYSGYLLSQDTYFVGTIKGVGKVYLHTAVDTFSSLGFALLHTTKEAAAAALLVHNEILPFYRKHGIKAANILTDNGREFCGTEEHPFQLYLSLNEIKHRRTKVASPQTNGFVERFHRSLGEEFFRQAFRKKMYPDVQSLQYDLDKWLYYYNHERPHLGYRNMGRKPYETYKISVENQLKKTQ